MYHVNPKTGEPGTCKAMKSCPFGGLDAHYTSEEAARAAYEASQGGAFSTPKPRVTRVPAPKTKSEFDAAILKVIPKPEDSTVVAKPKIDTKEASGAIRYSAPRSLTPMPTASTSIRESRMQSREFVKVSPMLGRQESCRPGSLHP